MNPQQLNSNDKTTSANSHQIGSSTPEEQLQDFYQNKENMVELGGVNSSIQRANFPQLSINKNVFNQIQSISTEEPFSPNKWKDKFMKGFADPRAGTNPAAGGLEFGSDANRAEGPLDFL